MLPETHQSLPLSPGTSGGRETICCETYTENSAETVNVESSALQLWDFSAGARERVGGDAWWRASGELALKLGTPLVGCEEGLAWRLTMLTNI